jgi:hypothetical protein
MTADLISGIACAAIIIGAVILTRRDTRPGGFSPAEHRAEQRRTEPPPPVTCRHCDQPIAGCPEAPCVNPKGWFHLGMPDRPIGKHYCAGRSINPLAEPAEAAR